jgi:hypothetical protein
MSCSNLSIRLPFLASIAIKSSLSAIKIVSRRRKQNSSNLCPRLCNAREFCRFRVSIADTPNAPFSSVSPSLMRVNCPPVRHTKRFRRLPFPASRPNLWLPIRLCPNAIDGANFSASRCVKIFIVENRIGFGQSQTVFVDFEFFALAFLSRSRVITRRAFVKQKKPAVENQRRAIIIERKGDFAQIPPKLDGIISHRFEFFFPKLVAARQAKT